MEPKTDNPVASHHDDQTQTERKLSVNAEIPGVSNGSNDFLKRRLGNRQVRLSPVLDGVQPIESENPVLLSMSRG